MEKCIALIKGDGIGPEIIDGAKLVLDKIAEKFGHTFTYKYVDMGGCSIDKYGEPLIESELQKCLTSDSVLLGAVGGSKWDSLPGHLRPEKGLLRLRKEMEVFANYRPSKIWKELSSSSPLKDEIVNKGVDFVILRELTGGIYFGKHETKDDFAIDELKYSVSEIERIGKKAFELALKRRKKLCSVEKSNVLDSSRLWKKVLHSLSTIYPDVELTDMLVDNCAMQLIKNPGQFDVIVTENMFGDILSDEASQICGSIGMMASSSIGETSLGLYEPIHGSAPDICGMDIANPIGTILSAKMMLSDSFNMEFEARKIEEAVEKVLNEGYRTKDIFPEDIKRAGQCSLVGCKKMAELICERI